MTRAAKMKSSVAGLLAVGGVVLFGVNAWPSAAMSDPPPVPDGVIFRLTADSAYLHGCFSPCMCPLMIQTGVRGTFRMVRANFDGAVREYAVEDAFWTVPAAAGAAPQRVSGSGKYWVGSPDPATVVQHRMVLDLHLDDEPVQHFDSGWVPVEDTSNIHLNITVSMNNLYCFDTAFVIDADPVPASEIQPYVLVPGSTFQRGCFDPCDCLLGPQHPMIGTFALVPLAEGPPAYAEFAVVNVDWHVLFNSAADGIPIGGSGLYQRHGDLTEQHRLTLALRIGDEPLQHLDSGWVPGGFEFPVIDAVVSMNNQVCYDTVLHVVGHPADVVICDATGAACPAGQFCKKPAGHCDDDVPGICTPIPNACPDVWDPVCGCDGVTYGNACEADMAAVSLAHFGPCDDGCRPTDDGFGCVPVVCSDIPEEQCIATVLHLDISTGAIHALACECLDFNFCHIEFGDASPFAVGYCPNGGTCEVVARDTDGDGMDDWFTAECSAVGACCTDVGGSPLPVIVCDEVPAETCPAVGSFKGPGTTCAATEACCLPLGGAGYCQDTDPFCCSAFFGVAGGAGTNCTDFACGDTCGGFTGIPCEPGWFCKFPEGSCNWADMLGVCTPVPQGCPDHWDPVCGCDGVTYGNMCDADAAGVTIDHRGDCVHVQVCGGPNHPPCDEDEFCKYPEGSCGAAGDLGVCTPTPNNGCPEIYDPVCGCDGVTYNNPCEADAARVSLAHHGPCEHACSEAQGLPPCMADFFCLYPEGTCDDGVHPGTCTPQPGGCPDVWDPVCGCDGLTYSNECDAYAAGVSIRHRGECERICGGLGPNPPCEPDEFCKYPPGTCGDPTVTGVCTNIPQACPEYYDPVCGCDGVTYGNECEADMAAVSIAHFGECGGTPCAATRHFVNANDVVTGGTYCPGVTQTVVIVITPPAGTVTVGVEDTPPDGWVVGDISQGGTYDAVNGKVKWGPFFAPEIPPRVAFNVTPTNDTSIVACFAGQISVNGINEQVCGDACLELMCPAFMPADVPQPPCPACPIGDCTTCPDGTCHDGRVSLCELIGYACAWKTGCNDDLAAMTRAAYIWRHGECYCWDEDQGNWFPADCPPPASGQCEGARDGQGGTDDTGSAVMGAATPAGKIVRGRAGGVAPHLEVPIRITAPAGALAMAVEVYVPAAWDLVAISDGGQWDESHRKIKWGPFFDELSRTVTFEIVPASADVVQPKRVVKLHGFAGRVSFDGVIRPIAMR